MLKLMLTVAALAGLSGCATRGDQHAPEVQAEPTSVGSKQRQCLIDKRRLEVAIKDSQKQVDELQKKLEELLAIDRELRSKKAR